MLLLVLGPSLSAYHAFVILQATFCADDSDHAVSHTRSARRVRSTLATIANS